MTLFDVVLLAVLIVWILDREEGPRGRAAHSRGLDESSASAGLGRRAPRVRRPGPILGTDARTRVRPRAVWAPRHARDWAAYRRTSPGHGAPDSSLRGRD